ncbi:aspartyl/asparaginyl beta-hydroxylase isoform X6 [Fundulus heteroclitus]|uniref:aspartyl/asparaginyl beta-hydroxylase isoform X6 n=1 Tax=Fundulus heteroclitus TaxID=8078 RepID=UPI00165A2FD4|nr:aspartyl/asparaginyl beta-hydroxylase isoform X6 [Fundulus heteroclitus]
MQRYQHHGAAPVEEIHAEGGEVCQQTGGANEEEVRHPEEPAVQKPEGKTAAVEHKNGKRSDVPAAEGGPRFSTFSWFVVLALLGVWSSVAVLYFDIVDYDSVIARAQEFRMNFSEVLQGKLAAYDTDGDGDFDAEDAKVLLGETSEEAETNRTKGLKQPEERGSPEQRTGTSRPEGEPSTQRAAEPLEEETAAAVPLPPFEDSAFVPDDPTEDGHPYEEETNTIDTTGVLLEEPQPDDSEVEPGRYLTSSRLSQEPEAEEPPEPAPEPTPGPQPSAEPEPRTGSVPPPGSRQEAEGAAENRAEAPKEKEKKKKPKLLNKLDRTIKADLDAAEKLRKKGKLDEALKAFDSLVRRHPLSPRARYGKAQAEDDLAEKQRSNEMLQRAIATYGEAAELPDATPDLLRAALRRRAERQQFLGRMRGSLATLQRLLEVFPDDVGLRNDLGVAHLLLGDNKGAKRIYQQVLAVAPSNGFAKVHYGFILKAENQIAESIPYLKEGLESGEPGTDDGRFYFHLGDALQRVGDDSAYFWYELGHQRGHFASVWQRSLYNVEGLKAQPWWTPQETGYTDLVKMLERNWRTIRDEALAVMDQSRGHFLPEEENLREKGEWGQYTLWQQGKRAGNACQGVPKTCALMERFPEATGCKRGQIKFSVMQPGTHVWPHTGPTNCRLRMHLGLVVPRPGCRIRCTNQTREWQEGRVLIFDDSFEHEVWQEAASYRLIFIVDVWHPQLTQNQRQNLSPI